MESIQKEFADQPFIAIGFRLTPEEDAAFRQRVKDSGISISNYVRKALSLTEEVRKQGRKPKVQQTV